MIVDDYGPGTSKSSTAVYKWAKKICMKRIKDLAIVNFQLSSPTVARTVRNRRVTYSDIIATIGKHFLGLMLFYLIF